MLGLAHSLLLYYTIPGRGRAWRRFYGAFIQPGQLAFDIGAHLGNRSRALLANGARVVALEPQALCLPVLDAFYGKNPRFTILANAVAAQPGRLDLLISGRHPTVSTLSSGWAEQVARDPSFARVHWDKTQAVTAITLDGLIAEYGIPSFCKLDIEGFELEALKGLNQALPALSFEYLPAAIQNAMACVDRLAELGNYTYNLIHGECPRLAMDRWRNPGGIKRALQSIPSSARAGEVYARLKFE